MSLRDIRLSSPAKGEEKKLKAEDIPGAELDLSDYVNKENVTPLHENTKRSNGYQCSFYNCNSQFYVNGQRTTFHFFKVPLISPQKNIWCNRMGKRDGKDGFIVTKYTKVCHLHFKPEDILKVPGGSRWRLKDGTMPMKFGKLKSPMKRKPPPLRLQKVKPARKLKFETNDLIFQPKSLLTLAILAMKKCQNLIVEQNKSLKKQLEDLKNKNKITENNLQQQTFNIDILHNDKRCQHYTGFPNYKRIEVFLDFLNVGENGKNVRMREASEGIGGSGRPRLLKPEDQLFMTLVKLRRGFSNMHCSWLFKCAESTVSRIICSWLNFLYLRLCTLPIWPSREEINQSMPDTFKMSFPNTRAILDCTEIFVESPESLHLRSTFYSDYKHHNTYKALIAITPAGSLSFVSELYPGSVSDREITSRCGILNSKFWEKGDMSSWQIKGSQLETCLIHLV